MHIINFCDKLRYSCGIYGRVIWLYDIDTSYSGIRLLDPHISNGSSKKTMIYLFVGFLDSILLYLNKLHGNHIA